MTKKLPLIAVTMGDPAGVGPEIILRGFTEKVYSVSRPVVIGDSSVLKNALSFPGISNKKINIIASPDEGRYDADTVNIIDLKIISPQDYTIGTVDKNCGNAAVEYIRYSIDLAMSHRVDAVATAPINKESLKAANIPYIGHTEIFAALTATPSPLTIFSLKDTLVFFLSRHISLRDACNITEDGIIDCVKRSFSVMKQFGMNNPSMAVAGLNPHCGEHGLFGDEEVKALFPAVEKLRGEGYNVCGPIGADSVFFQAFGGKYDSVLSLYHDQGHIATKSIDFYRTISVTGGMPILRTSVDHGTAFDIAGKGIASGDGMEEAITVAAKYAPKFFNE